MDSKERKELEQKIARLEAYLSRLRARLDEERLQEQHEAIERLDEYLDEGDHLYCDFREYLETVKAELRHFFSSRTRRE